MKIFHKAIGLCFLYVIYNSALALMPSTGVIDGSSFQKNFYLISANNESQNKASYFVINAENKDEYEHIPTALASSSLVLGYREVFFMDTAPHALIKVTELFPVAGRQHFAFYNVNSWSKWTTITPS